MSHNFTLICTNFSYFDHAIPTGPKSFLKLIDLLQQQGKVTLLIIGRTRPVKLNFKNVEIITQRSFFNFLVKNVFFFRKQSAIIVDRTHILNGLLLKLIYRKPLIIRMLGRGRRLQSKRLLSFRNLLRLITKFAKPDLLIETIDGSYPLTDDFIYTKILHRRLNGVPPVRIVKKDKFKIVTTGRYSPEKQIDKVVSKFLNDFEPNGCHLTVFGCTEEQFSNHFPEIWFENINFMGFSTEKEIYSELESATYFISGNALGYLGNAELEALAHNCQIVYVQQPIKSHLPEIIWKHLQHPIEDIASEIGEFDKIHQEDVTKIMRVIHSH